MNHDEEKDKIHKAASVVFVAGTSKRPTLQEDTGTVAFFGVWSDSRAAL